MVATLDVSVSMAGGIQPQYEDWAVLRQHRLLWPAVDKASWADRHLATLEYNIRETFASPSDRPELRANLNTQTGYHVFRVKTVPDLTTLHYSFEHAVADVVDGFRSALDKLAWRLACDFSPTGEPPDPTGVHFPIRDSISDFQARERRASSQVSSTVWQFFESFQPYLERNGRADAWSGLYVHPLSLLRDLSNDDKHRDTQARPLDS